MHDAMKTQLAFVLFLFLLFVCLFSFVLFLSLFDFVCLFVCF